MPATTLPFRLGLLPRRQKLQTRSGALEYVVSGSGSGSGSGQPTIVLLNGAGVTLEGWRALYPAIEQVGPVFAWNRFGIKGRSLLITAVAVPRQRPRRDRMGGRNSEGD